MLTLTLALAGVTVAAFIAWQHHKPAAFAARVSGLLFDLGVNSTRLDSADRRKLQTMSLAAYRDGAGAPNAHAAAVNAFLAVMLESPRLSSASLHPQGTLAHAIEFICRWCDAGLISEDVAQETVGRVKQHLMAFLERHRTAYSREEKIELELIVLGLGATSRPSGAKQYWGKGRDPGPSDALQPPAESRLTQRIEERLALAMQSYDYQLRLRLLTHQNFLASQGLVAVRSDSGEQATRLAHLTVYAATLLGIVHASYHVEPSTLVRFTSDLAARIHALGRGDRSVLSGHAQSVQSDLVEVAKKVREGVDSSGRPSLIPVAGWLAGLVSGSEPASNPILALLSIEATVCLEELVPCLESEFED